jgi:hypothetical protein
MMLAAAVSATASVPGPVTMEKGPASNASSTSKAMAGEQIKWQVISSGGTNGTSTNFKMQGTVGQTATGWAQSVNYKINQGFWQDFGSPAEGCCDHPGDANNNNVVNILDVTFTIAFLYKGGPLPSCPGEIDSNGNGITNILDVTYTIAFLYKSGMSPVCGP